MQRIAILLGSCFLANATLSLAYETETHALITRQAIQNSILANTPVGLTPLVTTYGLDRLEPNTPFSIYWQPSGNNLGPAPLNLYYMDGGFEGAISQVSGDSVSRNFDWPEAFEQCQMREFLRGTVDLQFQSLFANVVSVTSSAAASDTVLPIENWIVRGAIREDDIGLLTPLLSSVSHCGLEWTAATQYLDLTRSINHFYDPYWDRGLDTFGSHGKRAVDWALGFSDSFAYTTTPDDSRQNYYSYTDARNNLYWALTRQLNRQSGQFYTEIQREADAEDRTFALATTFRSLGDVLHLLEDMGQPQHTRDDPHAFINSQEQQAFEGYTNARILHQTDFNSYVSDFFGNDPPVLTVPPITGYPTVKFTTPARYFSTRNTVDAQPLQRLGLADYTNRGFFSGGTLPFATSNPNYGLQYALPPLPITDGDGNALNGYTKVPVDCPILTEYSSVSATTCAHYTHDVPDSIGAAADFTDALPGEFTQPPIASDSVFTRVLNTQEVAIGIEELDTMGNLTIPRAVGYATGMINYFFRGKIEVQAPSDGLIALVDDSVAHTDENGFAICSETVAAINPSGPAVCTANGVYGFTAVRLNIRNDTGYDTVTGDGQGSIQESGVHTPGDNLAVIPQLMSSTAPGQYAATCKIAPVGPNCPNMEPTIVAVARYHRNGCYKQDLSGERSFDGDGNPFIPSCADGLRTPFQEISVSNPLVISDTKLNVPPGGASTQTFDFSADPIPINATDLFIQVVYRGPLGQEDDGIAVGTLDVTEPMYLGIYNNNDYFFSNLILIQYADAQAESLVPVSYLPNSDMQVSMFFNGYKIFERNAASAPPGTAEPDYTVPVQRFVRVALLTTYGATYPYAVSVDQNGASMDEDVEADGLGGMVVQNSMEDGSGFLSLDYIRRERGVNLAWFAMGHTEANPSNGIPNPWKALTISPTLTGTPMKATVLHFPVDE